MRLSLFTLVVALAYGTTPTLARSHSAADCLAGLATTLRAGDFSGSLDCKHDQLRVRPIGEIEAAGHHYRIYDYHYKLAPACPECAVHGGQRIIITRDGNYLGQYKPDFVRVRVSAGKLFLKPEEHGLPSGFAKEARIIFARGGPPQDVWVGGQNLSLFR